MNKYDKKVSEYLSRAESLLRLANTEYSGSDDEAKILVEVAKMIQIEEWESIRT